MFKNTFILLVTFLLGAWLTKSYYTNSNVAKEEATVLLEKIETVKKLVTVEGHFTEIYNYSEYQGAFSLLWDKKALVRVKATVSAGYDLEQMKIETVPETHTLKISTLPTAKILSIDHTLDYYDLTQGLFTSFSPEDYNKINQKAKDLIYEQAMKSNLLQEAKKEGDQTIALISMMAESAGWKVEIAATPFSQ
jgi:Protein of unknown function (DUF4230)